MRVLIIDDSVVFRSAIKTALDGIPGIEIAGSANNGRIALQKLAQSSIDLVTLDMEMPELGGIETIREMKKAGFKARIIVFSAHTTRGSEAALAALSAGADDFVAKPTGTQSGIEAAAVRIREELLPKVRQFVPSTESIENSTLTKSKAPASTRVSTPSSSLNFQKRDVDTFRPLAIVIGSSTGGPPALEAVLKELSIPIKIPIFIAQHMPPVFTASLARRLENISGIKAAEAVDGEEILPNHIYVAPGDFHLAVIKKGEKYFNSLTKGPPRNSVRPSVDTLFESAAEVYGPKAMAFVLTGMGEDGLIGAKAIKKKGGGVMIQDRQSSVVFGMPGSIHAAGIYDAMGNLSEINSVIRKQGA